MLYGIRVDQQERLLAGGYDVRPLIAYGEAWYAWYLRRLAERPANLLFALRQLIPEGRYPSAVEHFPSDVVALLDSAREVDIGTVGRRTGSPRRTTIWIVVDDGVPYVRSEYGDDGQWYRNAIAQPHVTLAVRGRPFPALAVRVDDVPTWRRVSDAFKAKYRGSGAVRVMVRAEVEPMTLALEPDPTAEA
jgi:deazaflavin-dependent oxidoreductase (nitroreductase family)